METKLKAYDKIYSVIVRVSNREISDKEAIDMIIKVTREEIDERYHSQSD